MNAAEATERAGALLALGRAADALELVAPHLTSDEHPGPHGTAVAALLMLRRVHDAVRTAEDALARFGPLPHLTRLASHALRAAGDPTRALAVARAGAEQHPHSSPVLFALARAELAVGDPAAAEATAGILAAQEPTSPAVRLLAADIALARGDRGRARRHYQEALRVEPASVPALRGLGLLDEQRHRPGSAARWYADALRLRPGDQELVDRVRAQFCELLSAMTFALMVVVSITVLVFVNRADPRRAGGLPDAVWWPVVGFGIFLVVAAWLSVRDTPRVVLDALASEARTHRRVRRCVRLVLVSAGCAVALLLTMVLPVGTVPDRLPVVVPLGLLSLAVCAFTTVSLRRSVGSPQRPASPGPDAAG